MDDRLKHRLVGAIVLVALAVIFIPMILDGGHEKTLPPFGQAIPEKPAVLKAMESVKPLPLEKPQPPAMIERQLVDKHSAVIKPDLTTSNKVKEKTAVEAKLSNAKTAKPHITKKGGKAWVVQVGSFEQQKNALALRDKLRKRNFKAFVEAIKTDGSWKYRVRVGPEVRRSSSETTQKALLKKFKINGVVMGHP